MSAETIQSAFRREFGGDAEVFAAPGHVNIMGEDSDYNDGFVLPAAIDFYNWVASSPRSDRQVVAVSTRDPYRAILDLHAPQAPQQRWTDYVFGVALTLEQAGYTLRGANVFVDGDIPLGAGLGGSASLSVAVALSLLFIAGQEPDRTEVARLCQQAESRFAGQACSITDALVAGQGRPDHALLVDCRNLGCRALPLLPSARLVICNSMVHHPSTGSELAQRHEQCRQGLGVLQQHRATIQTLRDATVSDLQECAADLPDVVFRRCRHVVSENLRVEEAALALERRDMGALGRLMWASHRSLQEDFEVSCKELDLLVEVAMTVSGVYGARLTGRGFGGCTVNLVEVGAVENFRRTLEAEYKDITGLVPEVYISKAVSGAGPLMP